MRKCNFLPQSHQVVLTRLHSRLKRRLEAMEMQQEE